MSAIASPSDYAYRKRTTLTWRQRLARFLRGERRTKATSRKNLSQSPPRLGPIGDDVLRFDTKAALSPTLGTSSLVSDFAALKFDERGTLTGGFDINFESKDFKKKLELDSNGRTNGVGRKSGVKSPKRSSANSKRTSTQAAVPNAPALEVAGLEEGGFLDTWMKETEKKEQEKERVRRQEEAKEESKRASIVSAYSMSSVARKPLATQTNEKAMDRTSISLSREQSVKRTSPHIGASISMFENIPYNRKSVTSDPMAIPEYNSMFPSKRKADDQVSGTSPPKMRPTERKNDSMMMPPPPPMSSYPFDRTPPLGTTSTFRQSFDLTATDSGRSTSGASKRLSTSSMTSFTSGHAQRLEYSRPGATAKIVDSDAVSIASTATSSAGRRFEVRTETGLLKPVSTTSADKQARQVSQTISRINSNSINAPLAPTSAPRTVDLTSPRRVFTDAVKSTNKSDDEILSRRLSAPATRNSYIDPGTAANLSRTPTPEAGMTDGNPASRSRRPSSRLSDRMSWLRELEESNNKNNGRDFVFKKLEGGVAAKLAAFETKTSGPSVPSTPAVGLSRSNSISKSEAYGIERIPSHLSRSGTMDAEKPGNVADKVDNSFKKKLEDMTGNMAEKLQKKASASGLVNTARGPAALAAKKKLVPQDVLDMIEMSGVDQEVAINEYLHQHGISSATNNGLGRTKTWDHDEIMNQLNGIDAGKKDIKLNPKEEMPSSVVEKKDEIKTSPVVEPVPEPKAVPEKVIESVPEPKAVPEKVVEPVVESKTVTTPAPVPEPVVAKPVEQPKPAVSAIPVPASIVEQETKTSAPVEKIPEATVIAKEQMDEEKQQFNAASLPLFG